ncbi:MAG: toprim domain-containing protein [Candidatus Hodarchaeota archaeon]
MNQVLNNEALTYLLEFINYSNELGSEAIFIVEGKRDTETLRLLGLTGKIVEKGQRPFQVLVDLVSEAPTIVILTDFDREGKYLRKAIIKEIQSKKNHGIIDNYARQLLFKLCRAFRITEIEDLDRFAMKIQKGFDP